MSKGYLKKRKRGLKRLKKIIQIFILKYETNIINPCYQSTTRLSFELIHGSALYRQPVSIMSELVTQKIHSKSCSQTSAIKYTDINNMEIIIIKLCLFETMGY